MDSLTKFLETNKTIILGVVVIAILYYLFFYTKKDKFTSEEEEAYGIPTEEKIYGIPSVKTTPEGEVHHAIIQVNLPSTPEEKPVVVEVKKVLPSEEATVTIKPTVSAEGEAIAVPIVSEETSPIVKQVIAEEAEYGGHRWPCSKASLSPYDTQIVQGYEDRTSLYVPCSMNYDFPQIYQYRVIKKQNYDVRKQLGQGYKYEKYNPSMSVDGYADYKVI
jgi:hypothetical protein